MCGKHGNAAPDTFHKYNNFQPKMCTTQFVQTIDCSASAATAVWIFKLTVIIIPIDVRIQKMFLRTFVRKTWWMNAEPLQRSWLDASIELRLLIEFGEAFQKNNHQTSDSMHAEGICWFDCIKRRNLQIAVGRTQCIKTPAPPIEVIRPSYTDKQS